MVRIPCHVRKFVGDRDMCFVLCSLKFNHIFGVTEVLVDTGSPFSVLSPTDAIKLNLPISTMHKGQTICLAGFKFINHPLGQVHLNFKCAEGQHSVDMNMGVLVPTKISRAILKDVQSIPSIVGIDFLEDNKLIFYFDPSEKIAYLETKDQQQKTI